MSGGQSTQMIIGATPETDYQILNVAESLYQKFELKRVFYSAFVKVNEDKSLPALPGGPPLLREHRLYQADWLLRFYGFRAEELLDERRPYFNVMLDPKEDSVFYIAAFLSPLICLVTNRSFHVTKHQKISRPIPR